MTCGCDGSKTIGHLKKTLNHINVHVLSKKHRRRTIGHRNNFIHGQLTPGKKGKYKIPFKHKTHYYII